MNLSKIEYFFKAAELENFTQAAQVCHIAQTTMSKYIAELEEELDVTLFVRSAKSVKLTEAGQNFYDGMQKVYSDYERLLQTLRRGQRQEVHIGMITRDYAEFPVLSRFEKEFPQCSLFFSYGEEAKVVDQFVKRQLDALICPDFLKLPEMSEDDVIRQDLSFSQEVLIYARELAEQHGSLKNILCKLPLITKSQVASYTDACREKLKAQYGGAFDQVIVVKEYHQQVLMVNMAKGYAIVPDHTYHDSRLVEGIPLPEAFDEVTQLVYHREGSSKQVQSLADYLSSNVKR